jgi:23S rRNA (guanosine2251-2'-O)-methyltransferase
MKKDSDSYLDKKQLYRRMLTIYGRKAVQEALHDKRTSIHRIHLANSNKPANILDEIIQLAEFRNVEISYKDRAQLSRISKNSKQDQGVAADINLDNITTLEAFIDTITGSSKRYLLLDGIQNPQNLGMIIRSSAAAGIDALIVPEKNTAALGPLAIKASVGAIFKCPLVRCDSAKEAALALKQAGVELIVLNADAKLKLGETQYRQSHCYILGNESNGVSETVEQLADSSVSIAMQNNVESLNVAVTAALIAYLG